MTELIKRLDLSRTSYIFSIVTRGGSPSGVLNDINRLLKVKGKKLDMFCYMDMPNNQTVHHNLDSGEEIAEKFSNMKKKVSFICGKIIRKEKYYEKDPHSNIIKEKVIFPILNRYFRTAIGKKILSDQLFYIDSNCKKCGLCEKVCLSGKIRQTNGCPFWETGIKCYLCFACVNYCPVKAVQVKLFKSSPTERYHHPEIQAYEIALQK